MMTLRGSYNYLWDVSKQLGQGATSMVYRGRNKSTGEEVAVKVFTQAGNMRPVDVQMREYNVMRKLKHQNIVPLLDIEEEQGTRNRVIVMELTEYGSLFTMLEEPQNAYGLEEEEFLRVFSHVTSGVKHLYENDIVHRDIKPGNILRFKGEDGRSIYKLTDFGAAKELEHEEEQFMSLYGTEEYLHPDIYQRAVLRNPVRNAFTSKVDLWSLGVTLFHLATGQLPFKPYGGRKNRDKMYQITRGKESGVIMGVQLTEGGPIQWSKELPQTCRLSLGLKLLLTPVIAGLLESKPERVWTFDYFFQQVATIIKKMVVHVFSPQNWAQLKVYINKDSNLTQFQELIAEQTEIVSNNQLLIFDGQLLTEFIQPMQAIVDYPKGINENNPVVCFNKVADESYKFPDFSIKEFPKFTSSLSPDDYPIAKMCSGISCYTMKEVEAHVKKQALLRRSVHVFVQELYHEIQHLLDYHHFLNKNCQTTIRWKEIYERMSMRELEMLNLLPWGLQAGEINTFVLELQLFQQESDRRLDETYQKVSRLSSLVSNQLDELRSHEMEGKVLKNQWSDEYGCCADDRCVDKMGVLVNHVLKIRAKFNEDRKKPSLNFNDEQIHKFDKNKLSEWCIKVKSLFHDHCFTRARQQYRQFLAWYRSAQECRVKSERVEKRLLDLAEEQEKLAETLNEQCLLFHEKIDEFIKHLKDKDRPGSGSRSTAVVSKKVSSDHTSQHTMNLVRQLVNWLTENQKAMIETRRLVEQNTELMHQKYQPLQMEKDKNWKPDYKNDVVYLHVLPRSYAGSIANISPFALKVETWLRITNIPFQVIDYPGMSKKGQSPFILFNGEEIPDSNFIIEHLCKYFNKDPYPGLTEVDKAIARAFLKMIEENTAWPIFIYRYVDNADEYAKYFMPKAPVEMKDRMKAMLQASVADRARKHGIGRHPGEEVHKIGCGDIQAISTFLGSKPYLMGDNPSLVDCSLFGVLSQVVCVPMEFPERKFIQEKCPNIIDFVERIKTRYWPDWEEQCQL